jgi:hypothetical protein
MPRMTDSEKRESRVADAGIYLKINLNINYIFKPALSISTSPYPTISTVNARMHR